MLKSLAVLFLIYTIFCIFMWWWQEKLLFYPHHDVRSPADYNLTSFKAYSLKTEDGITLQAWYSPANAGFPTILYLHGNGGHIGYRAERYHAFKAEGFGVLALSWRGYGNSEGTPSEQGFYLDARAAIKFAIETMHMPENQLVFFGESLGTGVATQMGTEFSPAAIVLQSPYRSVAQRASEIYWYLPVKWLIRHQFPLEKRIEEVHAPLLILHGERDNVIPIGHGKAIFARANEPKQAIYYPNVAHENFDSYEVAKRIRTFLEKHKK